MSAGDQKDRVIRKMVIVTAEAYLTNPKYLITSTGEIERMGIDFEFIDNPKSNYRTVLALGADSAVASIDEINETYIDKSLTQATLAVSAIFNQELILPRKEYLDVDEDYKELIDELLYFQAEIMPSGAMRYSAPSGDGFFDDAVCSLAQLNYMCRYITKERKNRRIIDLGDGIKYLLKFHRNNKSNNGGKIINGRVSTYMPKIR
jgi:hypothetical protein